MKSLWCAALAVAVTLGGCGIAEPRTDDLILKDPEIPSVSSARHTSQPESSVSSGAPDTQEKPFPVLPEEYGLLCEAAGLMGDPEASVQTWPVGLDAVRGMRVPDSWELRRSIAALLADADLEKLDSVPEMAASESDPISIQIDLEDQWASIAVSLLSESDAANPGGAYLEVSGSQTVSAADGASSRTDDAAFPDVEAYAGNRVLYEQFAALIEQHTEEVHADFGGKATILRPAPGASETAAIENAMVQIGDILLLGWRDIGQADRYWMLEAHNTDTGGMLYQIPLGERLLTRISPSNAFEQFDYCLFSRMGCSIRTVRTHRRNWPMICPLWYRSRLRGMGGRTAECSTFPGTGWSGRRTMGSGLQTRTAAMRGFFMPTPPFRRRLHPEKPFRWSNRACSARGAGW